MGATGGVDRSRRWAMLGAVVIGGAGVVALGLTQAHAAEAPAPRPAVRVVTVFDQAPSTPPDAPTRTTPADGASASAPVTAFIPARTFVHLDADGAVTEVMTNSGRPPAPSDQFFVSGDGPARPLDAETASAVVASVAGGDWSEAGRWHAV